MVEQVEKYLLDQMKKRGVIHLTLIDPEKETPKTASNVAKEVELGGTTAIMVGGSTAVSTPHVDAVVGSIKKSVKIPVILFPSNVTGISRHADAIWFMSLLNSANPYFITGAQALGAPLVKRYALEPIPMGYIVVGEGGTAAIIGQARPIPYNRPEVVAIYALAAQYLGMHFVYLEAGSGAKSRIPSEMIRLVKKTIKIPLIVGGGIKSHTDAKEIARAGADAIVTGTVVEEALSVREKIVELISALREEFRK